MGIPDQTKDRRRQLKTRTIADLAQACEQGDWKTASLRIAANRYNPGSTALAVALELLKRNQEVKGIELVERLHTEVSFSEDSGS